MIKTLLKNFVILLIIEAVAISVRFVASLIMSSTLEKGIKRYEQKQKPSVILNTIHVVFAFVGASLLPITYCAVGLWIVSSWVKLFAVLASLLVVFCIFWGYLSAYTAALEIARETSPCKIVPLISFPIIATLAHMLIRAGAIIVRIAFDLSEAPYRVTMFVVEIALLILTVVLITASEIRQGDFR